MKKSQIILVVAGLGVLAAGAVAAIAGPAIYRDFIASEPAPAPELQAEQNLLEPAGAPLDPASLVGTWEVGTGSEAGYRVDEVLHGTDVTVTGRTEEVTGSLTVADDGLTLETAELSVDVASIATDSAQRDAYFRDRALRADEFPAATFTLAEPVALEVPPAASAITEATATGDLTIAGVTNRVTADVQVRSDGETVEVAGSIPVTFADYGVEAPNLGFVQVEPEGRIEFEVVAAKR